MPENTNGPPRTTDEMFPNARRVTVDDIGKNSTTATAPPIPVSDPDGSRPSGSPPLITRLNRADILRNALQTRKRKRVPMPEWGGDVICLEMTRGQREAVEGQEATRNPDGSITVRVPTERLKHYIPCILDEDGMQLFSVEDAATLAQMGNSAISRITTAIDALTTEDDEDADREAMRDPT